MTQGQAQARAISRALLRRGTATVRRVAYGRYEVESGTRAGRYHTVAHDRTGQHWVCSCEAGLAGRACWHQALILVLKIEAGGGRVVAPAAPAPAGELPGNVVPIRRAA